MVPTTADHHDMNNFSIALVIVYNGLFHDLADPQADSILFSSNEGIKITEASSALNSDKEGDLHVFDSKITVEPTVVSEIGGSTISVVSSDLEISGDTSCIFSAINTLGGLTSKSPASILIKHGIYKEAE